MNKVIYEYEEINLRRILIDTACSQSFEVCVQQSIRYFKIWMNAADPDNNRDM